MLHAPCNGMNVVVMILSNTLFLAQCTILNDALKHYCTKLPVIMNIFNRKIAIIITPKGPFQNLYHRESYADDEDAIANAIGDLLPSKYIHCGLLMEEDHPSIDVGLR